MRALLIGAAAASALAVLGCGGAHAQEVFIVEPPPVYVAPYYWPAPVIVLPYPYNSREGKAESFRWDGSVCFRGFPCSNGSSAMNGAGEWEPGPFIE